MITHNPANPPLRTWLREKQLPLHRSNKMKKALPDLPVVGERNSRNLRGIIIPTVLPPSMDKNEELGVQKCPKTCVTCREHLVETNEFKSSSTSETFKVKHSMTCDTDNVIYLLFCAKCDSVQYVGDTRTPFKKRLALHRTHIRKDTGTHVTKHFNSPNHCLQDMRAIPIEKMLTDNHTQRKSRETFWINKLKTRHPHGLNTRT